MALLMTIYSLYAWIHVMFNSEFKWVKFMLFLCVAQNANCVFMGVMVFLEISPYRPAHPYFTAYAVGASVFGFYFISNLMYWLFGFKYWVTAIEIPALVKQERDDGKEKKRFWTETRYNVLNWIGILINLFTCLWLGWKRGEMDFNQGHVSKSLADVVIVLELAVSFLLLISAFFLFDALRRL
jgi:hypothetical protein